MTNGYDEVTRIGRELGKTMPERRTTWPAPPPCDPNQTIDQREIDALIIRAPRAVDVTSPVVDLADFRLSKGRE